MMTFIYYLVPFWLIHTALIVSVLGIVASYFFHIIPAVNFYAVQIRVASVLLLLASVWFEGGIMWRKEIEQQRQEIARLEKESKIVTEVVVTKYVDRIKVVKEKGDAIVKSVPIYITKEADAKCDIPNGFVSLHDSAAKNELPPTPSDIDGASSGIKLSEVTTVVTSNYTTCNQIRQQLLSLQEWVREQERHYNK